MRRSAIKRHADAGFTLIELLIVIVILGILAAIVVFSVTGITDKGNKSACNATKTTIDVAYEAAVAQGAAVTMGTAENDPLLLTFYHNSVAPTVAGGKTFTGLTITAVDALVC